MTRRTLDRDMPCISGAVRRAAEKRFAAVCSGHRGAFGVAITEGNQSCSGVDGNRVAANFNICSGKQATAGGLAIRDSWFPGFEPDRFALDCWAAGLCNWFSVI